MVAEMGEVRRKRSPPRDPFRECEYCKEPHRGMSCHENVEWLAGKHKIPANVVGATVFSKEPKHLYVVLHQSMSSRASDLVAEDSMKRIRREVFDDQVAESSTRHRVNEAMRGRRRP